MYEQLSTSRKREIKINRLKELLGDEYGLEIEYRTVRIYTVTHEERRTLLGGKKDRIVKKVIAKIDDIDNNNRITVHSKEVYDVLKEFGNEFHFHTLLKNWPGVEEINDETVVEGSLKHKPKVAPMIERTNPQPRYERLVKK
jgi:hypothetical protein